MTKITNAAILSAFRKKMDLNKQDVSAFADAFQSIFQEALLRDKIVKISGLGTFKLLLVESRKSVNVNTGENIEIAEHYKLTFTPETSLKNIVNQPLEHLETVELSSSEVEIAHVEIPSKPEATQDNIDDPLQKLAEQALELKDILADIQGFSIQTQAVDNQISSDVSPLELLSSSQPSEQDSLQSNEPEAEQPTETPESLAEPEAVQQTEPEAEQPVEEPKPFMEPVAEQPTEDPKSQFVNEPQVAGVTSHTAPLVSAQDVVSKINSEDSHLTRKHSKAWIWVAIILLFAIVGLLAYQNIDYFLPPAGIEFDSIIADSSLIADAEPVTDTITPTSVDSLVLEEATVDSLNLTQPAEPSILIDKTSPIYSEQFSDLFNQTREYTEFIDTISLNEGSRLTWISLKYLGHKDFWVYIYEANMDVISDPNSIRIGTMLRIPKLNPALIDVANNQCFEYAKHLHDVYVKK